MVASQCLSMGNGSIKASRPVENSCVVSIHTDSSGRDTELLRLHIIHLEAELTRRDKDFSAQELQLRHLQKELEAKTSQIDKLQDAIGYKPRLGSCAPSVMDQGPSPRLRAKEGVSAEPTSHNFCAGFRASHNNDARAAHKNSATKRLINNALMNNDFLKKLEAQHMREMVECMYEMNYTQGQLVIQEGQPGNYLYVLAAGVLKVVQNGKLLGQMHSGTAFGELAILYNCKRTATVTAVSQAHIWALDRQSFQNIMMRTEQAKHTAHFNFLRSVSLLHQLPEEKIARIVDCLEEDYFEKGEYIIREGEEGNTFFIIAKGEVVVTQSTDGFTEPQQIKTLRVGDYFGEKALISEDVRSANIICNENDTHCLVVDRDNFNETVGTFVELQDYLKQYVEELSRNDERRNAVAVSPHTDSAEAVELQNLREKLALLPTHRPFQELEVVSTLGTGGFGRVELVRLRGEDTTFALKCIKKSHIVENRQQEHVYSEKSILQQTNSMFIIRFFRTFRDSRFVYILLEVCLGGELWTVLRDMGFFDDATARFCTGCVLEAFEYLHTMGVVYRDLKPENLLLDGNGYVKMADFGFAKKIGLGRKTWTFCGTPEYVAPEVILNKGHDFGADCWSLGILIFELLTGNPPFTGADPLNIYTMVLRGIEKVDFPKRIGKRPDDLIRRLCKLNPVERLGNKKNGIIDIKKHKWFQGFNWEGLMFQRLLSPLRRELKGPMDVSHFDVFPPDPVEPPEEQSGWDKDF
ncbi:cGMP-dependent protein kinase 2 [Gouania willdenowi]|uniref:cGMP-dependent protein kinase 2 n=1 Tax=Gouania willdenowi TaxID=441366 RepID=UPI001056D1D8|nr:cGMP-dependent protein kinase 2-like [Gouania willdenowi]